MLIYIYIRNKMTMKSFDTLATGIMNSALNYCLQVYGNCWGVKSYVEQNMQSRAFTKKDCEKLQVIQNKVLKIMMNKSRDYPTVKLLEAADKLSINQQVAYFTLMQTFNIVLTGKPVFLYNKMKLNQDRMIITVIRNSSMGRHSFCFRGANLFNSLPTNLRICKVKQIFKSGVKTWIKQNISLRPP